jgi:hypothetical protein
MFLAEFVTALIVAIFFSVLLVFALGWERPDRKGILHTIGYVFIIIFLFTWAGGVWLTPLGTTIGSVRWLPFFIVGFIVTLMLITLIPPRRRRDRSTIEVVEKNGDERINRETAKVLNIFFWVLVIILVITIVTHYLIWNPVI